MAIRSLALCTKQVKTIPRRWDTVLSPADFSGSFSHCSLLNCANSGCYLGHSAIWVSFQVSIQLSKTKRLSSFWTSSCDLILFHDCAVIESEQYWWHSSNLSSDFPVKHRSQILLIRPCPQEFACSYVSYSMILEVRVNDPSPYTLHICPDTCKAPINWWYACTWSTLGARAVTAVFITSSVCCLSLVCVYDLHLSVCVCVLSDTNLFPEYILPAIVSSLSNLSIVWLLCMISV